LLGAKGVTFVVNAFLAWAAGDLSEFHVLERKRTPKRVRANAWSDAARGESVNNSSRRLDGETRQEWTVLRRAGILEYPFNGTSLACREVIPFLGMRCGEVSSLLVPPANQRLTATTRALRVSDNQTLAKRPSER
jgi:hypothetical protein